MFDFQIGDYVWYRGSWGSGPAHFCRVTGFGEKNDQVVIDNDLGHWGYEEQYRAATKDDIAQFAAATW